LANKVIVLVSAHLNALVFFVGFACLGYGVARWSLPAACVALGAVLMTVAVWPYLGKRKPQ